MPQIIEWTNAGQDAIVWRYPNEDITWGAQLIVHEYEMAVFFRDGKAYDVFGRRQAHPNNPESAHTDKSADAVCWIWRQQTLQSNSPIHQHQSFRWQMGHKSTNHRACTTSSVRAILVQSRRRITVRQRSHRRTKRLHNRPSQRLPARLPKRENN